MYSSLETNQKQNDLQIIQIDALGSVCLNYLIGKSVTEPMRGDKNEL